MFCPKCGNQNSEGANFCRKCGVDFETVLLAPLKQNFSDNKVVCKSLTKTKLKDPDELTAGGIANVIIGDGFFMVAVLLSATHGSASSLLWLLLLIPAFFFFGKGIADVLQARQIQRRLKQDKLKDAAKSAELQPSGLSFIEAIKKQTSGELLPVASVTEGTTRDLG
jgi:hypothetical protein